MQKFIVPIVLLFSTITSAQVNPQFFFSLNEITTADREVIPITELTRGMMVYDLTEKNVYYYDGSEWVRILKPEDGNVSAFFTAEYPNAIFDDPGSDNIGCMNTINTGAANRFLNAYSWDTSESTPQSYDILIRYTVPANFATLQSDWFEITYAAPTSSSVGLTILKSDNSTVVANSNLATSTTFTTHTISANPVTAIAAGDILVIRLRLTSVENASAIVSDMAFNYSK